MCGQPQWHFCENTSHPPTILSFTPPCHAQYLQFGLNTAATMTLTSDMFNHFIVLLVKRNFPDFLMGIKLLNIYKTIQNALKKIYVPHLSFIIETIYFYLKTFSKREINNGWKTQLIGCCAVLCSRKGVIVGKSTNSPHLGPAIICQHFNTFVVVRQLHGS